MTQYAYITRSAVCLPGAPIENEQMEGMLGQVGERPSRARRIILKRNGIVQRYYAIDPVTHQATHTNASLTAEAVRKVLTPAEAPDALICGTSTPDQLMPNHAVMVQGELGWPISEVFATTGICLSGLTALKYAWLGVKSGEYQRVLATGSELSSAIFGAEQYQAESDAQIAALAERPELGFEKDFLRWMLSDAAGAFLVEPKPAAQGLSLRIDWIDLFSSADTLPPCMYAGSDKTGGEANPAELTGWMRYSAAERAEQSIMAVKQDVRLLNENVIRACFEMPLLKCIARRNLKADEIDWFLPHLSSMVFAPEIQASLDRIAFPLKPEAWYTNLATCGNTGAASMYVMIHGLLETGKVKAGDRILVMVPESGRFSSGYMHLTVVAPN